MKIPDPIREALDATGLPWNVEPGGRHWKLRLNGHLVGILPFGTQRERNLRAVAATVSNVRRKAMELASS